ncbi:MAG: hypothetical protein ACXAAO_05715 [Candidatus Thorarchaeota archaeon]
MTKMKLILPKTIYEAGEEIAGTLEIEYDKPFVFKRIDIRIGGEAILDYKVRTGSGMTGRSHVYKRIPFFEQETMILEDTRFEGSKERIEFSVRLPESRISLQEDCQLAGQLLPTLKTGRLTIGYTIQAEMTVSRKLMKIQTTHPLAVTIPFEGIAKGPVEAIFTDKGSNLLEIALESEYYCIGTPLEIRYRLNVEKIKKIHFKLSQYLNPPDKKRGYLARIKLTEWNVIPKSENLSEWESVVIPPQENSFQSITSDLWVTQTVLKVSIEYSRIDKPSIEIPLKAIHCPHELKPRIEIKKAESPIATKDSCPNCGAKLAIDGLIRPDGSVICPKCFRKFIPS